MSTPETDTSPSSDFPPESRFSLTAAPSATTPDSFAAEVDAGLSKSDKSLPSRFFYDAVGSALFEQICELPEYYLTRCERRILESNADDIVASSPPDAVLVELGSGSAEKTSLLIDAYLRRDGELVFVPIDISRSALEASSVRLLEKHPGLSVHALEGEYEDAIEKLHAMSSQPLVVAWLGSSIGNLTRSAATHFLRRVARALAPEDVFLVGIDLRKESGILEAAYNDSAGVTERFNVNLLERINRELGGEFEVERFRFEARYLEEPGVVRSELVSCGAQEVAVEALDASFEFDDGEAIHTEDSFKYSHEEIEALAEAAGMVRSRCWLDPEGYFSLNLLAKG